MGIYIFNRKLLFDLLENEIKDATDFGKEIIPNLLINIKWSAYQYDGYWTDIGNIYSFFEANLGLTDDLPDFNLLITENSIYTRARMLPPGQNKWHHAGKNNHCRRLYHQCMQDRTQRDRYTFPHRAWLYYCKLLSDG